VAIAERIAVLANRPLNAMTGNRMVRLADFETGQPQVDFEPQRQVVARLEAEFRRAFAPRLRSPKGGTPPENFFRWAEQLEGLPQHLPGLEQWREIEAFRIAPQVAHMVQALEQAFGGQGADQWQDWRDRYLPELDRLLAEIRRQAAAKSQAISAAVAGAINATLPIARQGESLSRKALWVVASTPGVTCVLVGMRQAAYVDDALGILGWPPLDQPLKVYEAVNAAPPLVTLRLEA
jgi:hypothetical protein